MAAFHFRLAQLTRLRLAEEEMQKRLLREQLAAARQAEQTWQTAVERVSGFSSRLQQVERQGLTVAGLQAYRRWLPHLEQQAKQARLDWQQAEAVADRQRESFRQARQQSKILANLQDRQLAAHCRQEQLLEQQSQDELAVQSWPRGGAV